MLALNLLSCYAHCQQTSLVREACEKQNIDEYSRIIGISCPGSLVKIELKNTSWIPLSIGLL